MPQRTPTQLKIDASPLRTRVWLENDAFLTLGRAVKRVNVYAAFHGHSLEGFSNTRINVRKDHSD